MGNSVPTEKYAESFMTWLSFENGIKKHCHFSFCSERKRKGEIQEDIKERETKRALYNAGANFQI